MKPRFLSLDAVLEIHNQQIAFYGGLDGVRDPGALESAVGTPQATFGGQYLYESTPAMAAAYLFHIAMNHPFLDGNKRAGANAAVTFLYVNDWSLDMDVPGFIDLVMAVASGTMGKAELTKVFEAQSRADGAIGSVY